MLSNQVNDNTFFIYTVFFFFAIKNTSLSNEHLVQGWKRDFTKREMSLDQLGEKITFALCFRPTHLVTSFSLTI